ncbi:MAG TPA: hypothetical protein VKU19_29615 [Bryobacteraceae bacterium]|nr:hypothetical protein [Bryobacteraceae bacterium]
MQKLAAVEEAKSLMREAIDWSLWGWLTEKRRLRTTADRAWAALEEQEAKVKASWSQELKAAYRSLGSRNGKPRTIPAELLDAVHRLKEAEEQADAAHMEAEDTFDLADRRMSTSMACEGARQAIAAWEMREKVIRKAESLGRKMSAESPPAQS